MNSVFADTSYFVALLNPRDQLAEMAREQTECLTGPMVTTWWVLVEVGNFLRAPGNRQLFLTLFLHRQLEPNPVAVAQDRGSHHVTRFARLDSVRQEIGFSHQVGSAVEFNNDVTLLKAGLLGGRMCAVLADVLDPQGHGIVPDSALGAVIVGHHLDQ